METRKVFAYKENGSWYIDDDNGFAKEENQLVAGIPEIIESLVGNASERAAIEYSDREFSGAVCLRLLKSDAFGSTYGVMIGGREMKGWLCPVFFHYFTAPPSSLFVRIMAA